MRGCGRRVGWMRVPAQSAAGPLHYNHNAMARDAQGGPARPNLAPKPQPRLVRGAASRSRPTHGAHDARIFLTPPVAGVCLANPPHEVIMNPVFTTLTIALLANLAGCIEPGDGLDSQLGTDESALELTPVAHYEIRTPGGQCVDIAGASTVDGVRGTIWPCHSGLHQAFGLVFHRTYGADLEVQFIARHSGKCLDVEGGSMASGAKVVQWPCHDGDNQRWYTTTFPSGAMGLRSKRSGLCLYGAANQDLYQASCDGPEANRAWSLHLTNVPANPPQGMTATLYPHRDYQGAPLTVSGDLPDLSAANWSDLASSIKLSEGGYVTVYSEPNYTGTCETIFIDAPWLAERAIGNDRISSIRLGSYCRTVLVYESAGYVGASMSWSHDVPALPPEWNDRVTAFLPSPGTWVTLYADVNYAGDCESRDLRFVNMVDSNVRDDRLSSFRFGRMCAQRNIQIKNDGSSSLKFKYRIKNPGAYWTNWDNSPTIESGERANIAYTEAKDVSMEVFVWDGVYWASTCKWDVNTAEPVTKVVSGSRWAPECSL